MPSRFDSQEASEFIDLNDQRSKAALVVDSTGMTGLNLAAHDAVTCLDRLHFRQDLVLGAEIEHLLGLRGRYRWRYPEIAARQEEAEAARLAA